MSSVVIGIPDPQNLDSYECNGNVGTNRTSSMPNSVPCYLLDEAQYFSLEFYAKRVVWGSVF